MEVTPEVAATQKVFSAAPSPEPKSPSPRHMEITCLLGRGLGNRIYPFNKIFLITVVSELILSGVSGSVANVDEK